MLLGVQVTAGLGYFLCLDHLGGIVKQKERKMLRNTYKLALAYTHMQMLTCI